QKMSEELGRGVSVLRFLLIQPPVEQPIQTERPATVPVAAAPAVPASPAPAAKPQSPRTGITTNEALEKRLEEILQ
ncbi:hypothetical protein ACI3PL_21715, partial [Lacticaseibacillus paracasei]